MRQIKSTGGGRNKPAECLPSVMEETQAQRERLGGEHDSVYESVPSVGLAFIDRFTIALHQAQILHGAETIELPFPDVPACELKFA